MGSIDKACISGFLCRLCSEMHRIVIHIYGDQGQRLCLVEKINGYLPITISPTDPLPKTICTTCLRRVEQHYDLLMRLSRIKEERFLRVNNKQRRPRVSPISSIENSEDEVYQSDEDSRRQGQQMDTSTQRQISQSQQSSTASTSATSSSLFAETTVAGTLSTTSSHNSATVANNIGDNEEDDVGDDDNDSGASTSASALAPITQNINVLNDANIGDSSSSSSTSSSVNSLSNETGNGFGIVLQQHTD